MRTGDAVRSTFISPADAEPDHAYLVKGFGWEIAHYNSLLKKWVACWDHRPITRVDALYELPEEQA